MRRTCELPLTSISKIGDKCGKEWDAHWKCLENNNQEYYACREAERPLNKCVLEALVRGY